MKAGEPIKIPEKGDKQTITRETETYLKVYGTAVNEVRS